MNQEHSVKTWHLLILLVLLPAAGWFGHRGVVDSHNVLDARRRYELATTLMVGGKVTEASVELEEALAEAPDFAEVYPDLSDAYFRLYHDRAVSIAIIRRGLINVPGNPELHGALGRLLYLHGDYPEAVKELEIAKSMGVTKLDELLDKARKSDAPKAGD